MLKPERKEAGMDKPTSIRIKEFCQGVSETCNNSGLPFYILEIYMENALAQVRDAAQRQRILEQELYEKERKEEENV